MELLVHGHVVAELFPHVLIHRLLEVPRLSRIEDLAEDVLPILRRLSLETDRLSKPSSDDFAEELIFDAIVEEDRAALDVEQVGEHLDEARQVELQSIVERDIASDVEKSQRVLDRLPCLQEEVVLSLAGAQDLGHG